MEFIYDGSHLIENGIEEECLFKYDNGLSLWIVFNSKDNSQKCIVKEKEIAIVEFKKVAEGEAFIKGIQYKQRSIGVPVTNLSIEETSDSEVIIISLKKQIEKLTIQKEKAQRLAEKLVKGIVKDKAKQTEVKIRELLELHVENL